MRTNAIYLPKWVELLITLGNTPKEQRYCGSLHRQTGITTRHLRTLTTALAKRNFVVVDNGNNKIRYIHLTPSGRKLAEALQPISPVLKR